MIIAKADSAQPVVFCSVHIHSSHLYCLCCLSHSCLATPGPAPTAAAWPANTSNTFHSAQTTSPRHRGGAAGDCPLAWPDSTTQARQHHARHHRIGRRQTHFDPHTRHPEGLSHCNNISTAQEDAAACLGHTHTNQDHEVHTGSSHPCVQPQTATHPSAKYTSATRPGRGCSSAWFCVADAGHKSRHAHMYTRGQRPMQPTTLGTRGLEKCRNCQRSAAPSIAVQYSTRQLVYNQRSATGSQGFEACGWWSFQANCGPPGVLVG
jgi:hypothetical protein